MQVNKINMVVTRAVRSNHVFERRSRTKNENIEKLSHNESQIQEDMETLLPQTQTS